jgi:hypothetical protein
MLKSFISELKSKIPQASESFTEDDQAIIGIFLKRCGLENISIDALFQAQNVKRVFIAEILSKSLETLIQKGIRLSQENEERRSGLRELRNAFGEESSKEIDETHMIDFFVIKKIGEHPELLQNILPEIEPQELWDLLKEIFISRKIPSKDGNAFFAVLNFLQGPILKDISGLMAAYVGGMVQILQDPKLMEA